MTASPANAAPPSAAPLTGRTALVTGAARGIGLAVAAAFLEAGAQVVLVDRDPDPLAAAQAALAAAPNGVRTLAIAADVTGADSIAEAVRQAVGRFGAIDIVMNNAAVGPQLALDRGTGKAQKFWDLPDEIWPLTLLTNVLGPQLVAKAVVPEMIGRGWGRIINVTTSLGTMYLSGVGAYGPSKAALEAHSRAMALDLAGTGVTCNILVPGGPVDTRMIDPRITVQRSTLLQPGLMAEPAIWLASDASAECNGMRFIAARWRTDLPVAQRIAEAGAPAAWPQLGAQSLTPAAMRQP